MIIQYPRNRKQQFRKLYLLIALFVAGFFWTIYAADLAQTYLGLPRDTVGMSLFIGNILSIGYGGMWMAHRWKDEIASDFRRVRGMSKITKRDEAWLAANCAPESYTVHALEGRWPQGEPKRLPPDLHVEFHRDEDRVLFEIARQR